jgi:hypothetical protein
VALKLQQHWLELQRSLEARLDKQALSFEDSKQAASWWLEQQYDMNLLSEILKCMSDEERRQVDEEKRKIEAESTRPDNPNFLSCWHGDVSLNGTSSIHEGEENANHDTVSLVKIRYIECASRLGRLLRSVI